MFEILTGDHILALLLVAQVLFDISVISEKRKLRAKAEVARSIASAAVHETENVKVVLHGISCRFEELRRKMESEEWTSKR